MHRTLSLLCLLPLLAAAAGRAATDFPLPLAGWGRQPPIVDTWTRRILQSREEVRKGRYESAGKKADRVIFDMLARIERGRAARVLLGSAVYVRALAAAGEGRDGDAAWDARVAAALLPDLGAYDPAGEGAAGAQLKEAVRAEEERFGSKGEPRCDSEGNGCDDLTPPEKVLAPPPTYPEGKRAGRVQASITIQVVIDRDGAVRLPSLVAGDDPSLIFSGLEAVRDWRFNPARIGEEPVSVFYNLEVNYHLGAGPAPK